MVFDTSSKSAKNFPPFLKATETMVPNHGGRDGNWASGGGKGAVPLSVLDELSTSTPRYPKGKSYHFSQH